MFARSFVCSFVCSFVSLFVRVLVRLFVRVCLFVVFVLFVWLVVRFFLLELPVCLSGGFPPSFWFSEGSSFKLDVAH